MINPIIYSAENRTPPLLKKSLLIKSSCNIKENIIGLFNCPVIIHRKIASNLNARDYASLRATCTVFRDNLYSFEQLQNTLANGDCKGSFKVTSEAMLEDNQCRHLKEKIHNDLYVFQALNSLEVKYLSRNKRIYYLNFKTNLNINEQKKDVFLDITRFIQGYTGCKFFFYDVELDRTRYLLSFNIGLDMKIIDYHAEDKFPAKLLFEAFQISFDRTKASHKYIIASYAASLIQIWNTHPPRNTDESTIDEIKLCYKKLIAVGNLAKSIAKEKNVF